MKKGKIVGIIAVCAICIVAFVWFRVSSNDKHISQKEAEEIAKNLVGGEVTFITESSNKWYTFTDAKGNEFSVMSFLSRPSIDGAIIKTAPLELSVNDNYLDAVFDNQQDKMIEILERYGFGECLGDSFKGFNDICLEVNLGNPEENKEVLKNFVAAGVEIDALLDISYDKRFYVDNGMKLTEQDAPSMRISFVTEGNFEGIGMREYSYEVIAFGFSTSADTRWTFDSLYEKLKKDIDNLEIAD